MGYKVYAKSFGLIMIMVCGYVILNIWLNECFKMENVFKMESGSCRSGWSICVGLVVWPGYGPGLISGPVGPFFGPFAGLT